MIALLLSMVRARWGHAVTVFALSVVAVAAAVAGPVSLRVVDAAVVRTQVATAPAGERSLAVTSGTNPSDPAAVSSFDAISQLLAPPGFLPVRAGEIRTFGPVPTGDPHLTAGSVRFVFRDQLCAHVVIVAGRCLAGPLDVLVGADTAARAGIRAGDAVDVQSEKAGANGQVTSDGPVATLTVSGLYQPRDPAELYWAAQYYFLQRADGTRDEPVFVTPQTFDLVGHTVGASTIDFLAGDDVLTPQRLAGLPAEIQALIDQAGTSGSAVTISSGLPDLAQRITQGQALAHELVPVAFLPLVGLSWFVVFLAAGYGVGARRPELGLVALRGVRPVRRWSLAVAETLALVLLGAPVGYLAGYAVVGLLARVQLGRADGAGLDLATVGAAAISLAGALVVALAGQRRALREPVVELLRGVPRPTGAWRSLVLDGAVVALAALGVLQLRSNPAGLTGVALVVPGLVVVAVTLLAARLFVPVVGGVARTALRRGYLGTGLAAVQIARRPGSQRLFALLAVATGLLSFVAAGQSVAAYARQQRAEVSVGATTVLRVERGPASRLLHVVDQVDPDGRWAMAALAVDQPGDDRGAPPVLAVDSGRLAAVATWRPEFGIDPASVAARLAPPVATPFVLRGDDVTVDLDRDAGYTGVPTDGDGDGVIDEIPPGSLAVLPLTLTFESLADGSTAAAVVTTTPGRHTYHVRTTGGCASGCRLTGLSGAAGPGNPVALTLYAITGPGGDVVGRAGLADGRRWRGIGSTAAVPLGRGLRIQLSGDPFDTGDLGVSVVDAPTPVPAIVTADQDGLRSLTGLDGRSLPARSVGTVTMLPALGTHGALVDLTYLLRVGLAGTPSEPGQVWLGPGAPADAVARLRAAGLAILSTSTVDGARAALDQSGPALALRFHLAAAALGIGLALGGLWLVAAVDRRRRTEDLRALRQQGLRARFVRRAALWGYLWLVVGAAVAGLGAAAVAWVGTGDHLPVLTDAVDALPPPRWPDPVAVIAPWAVAAAVMLAVAVVVAAVVSSAVRRRG